MTGKEKGWKGDNEALILDLRVSKIQLTFVQLYVLD